MSFNQRKQQHMNSWNKVIVYMDLYIMNYKKVKDGEIICFKNPADSILLRYLG